MTTQEVLKTFEDNEALLNGHFLLSSGLHSSQYLQCALVMQHPDIASKLCSELAAKAKSDSQIGQISQISRIDFVIAPALGGVVVAHETARALGVRALFTERQNGIMTLRRGFQIKPGERAFVVEDVVTTGGSTREVMDVVSQFGGINAGAGSLIDRSGGSVDLGVPRHALAVLNVKTYSPEECPMCKEGSKAVKPGSR